MARQRRFDTPQYEPKSLEEIRAVSRDLRKRLRVERQRAPDLWLLLQKLPSVYPDFRYKSVRDSDLPKIEAKAYGKARLVKIRESFLTALKYYGDPRARFTVAHEWGHIALGHPGNQPRANADLKDRLTTDPILEKEANEFAAEFLMPDNLFDPSMPIDELSRQFQVSMEAATRRKRQLENNTSTNKQRAVALARHDERPTVKGPPIESAPQTIQVFVSMAFNEAMNRLYTEIYKPTIEGAWLMCLRADEISSVSPIVTDIREAIERSALLIADISEFNANVMHEIGLAQSIDKPTIITCRSGYRDDEIPSNIRHIRRIIYPNDAGGGPVLRRQLEQTLQSIAPALKKFSKGRPE
jgi:Zn-dependent peptidase ImmA (M78 family)